MSVGQGELLSIEPLIMPKYDDVAYWDERYRAWKEPFDWLVSYGNVRESLRHLMPDQRARILVNGCGNAPLSTDLYNDGYTNQVNTDISLEVISQQRANFPHMDWRVMNVLDLRPFEVFCEQLWTLSLLFDGIFLGFLPVKHCSM